VALELLVFVAPEAPVRIARLTLTNLTSRRRSLSVAAYVEWVLGNSRAAGAPFVVTERDEATGALFASNSWNEDFRSRTSFAWISGPPAAVRATADRKEFLGRVTQFLRESASHSTRHVRRHRRIREVEVIQVRVRDGRPPAQFRGVRAQPS
jgi:cellobiose phosphorylase